MNLDQKIRNNEYRLLCKIDELIDKQGSELISYEKIKQYDADLANKVRNKYLNKFNELYNEANT